MTAERIAIAQEAGRTRASAWASSAPAGYSGERSSSSRARVAAIRRR